MKLEVKGNERMDSKYDCDWDDGEKITNERWRLRRSRIKFEFLFEPK